MNRYCNAIIASTTEIHVFKAEECTLLRVVSSADFAPGFMVPRINRRAN